MGITFLEKLPSYRLPSPTSKEDVIRYDYGCPTINLEKGLDVLEEVKLLVRGGCPEVLAAISEALPICLAITIDYGNTALLPKLRVSVRTKS